MTLDRLRVNIFDCPEWSRPQFGPTAAGPYITVHRQIGAQRFRFSPIMPYMTHVYSYIYHREGVHIM